MSESKDDVVKVATGDSVTIELHKQSLEEAGIEARVMGESLGASFGSAIPGSVELWVHRSDVERAEKILAQVEPREEKDREKFPRPTSESQPKGNTPRGPHTHYNPDPRP
jgi:hypothetical protein